MGPWAPKPLFPGCISCFSCCAWPAGEGDTSVFLLCLRRLLAAHIILLTSQPMSQPMHVHLHALHLGDGSVLVSACIRMGQFLGHTYVTLPKYYTLSLNGNVLLNSNFVRKQAL